MTAEHAKDELSRWNERYSAPDYVFGKAPNVFLLSNASRLRRGQRALCVADGEGRNSVWLAEQGLDVTAFDFSPVGVEKARRLAAEHAVHVDYHVADVHDWGWIEAAFDVVAAIFVQFADPAMRSFMFERMVRTLRPGGFLFLTGYTPKQLEYRTGGPSQVENLYTPELLRQAFGALDMVELKAYEAALVDGSAHSGLSAVIDLVAAKPRAAP